MIQSLRLYRNPSEGSQRRHLGKKKKMRESARAPTCANPQVCDECDMWLSRPSGMPCKKADRFQEKLAKFECDECGASLFRWMQSAATGRSRQEHCKYRHRRNGGGGSSQSPRRVGPEGGEGGYRIGPKRGCWQS